jgi:hypothetical protein
MKRLAGILLMLASLSAFGQVPIVTQNNSPAIDYLTTDLTAFAVTRFEMQLDSGSFSSIGLPATTDDAKTLPGAHTYAGPKLGTLGLSVGSHSFAARACNVTGCGAASLPLTFTYAPTVVTPANLRFQ